MTDPSKEISIDAFGADMFGEQGPEAAQLIADAAEGDPGEAGEAEAMQELRIDTSGERVDPAARARAEHEQMVAHMGIDPATPGADQTAEVLYERDASGNFHPKQVTPLPLPTAIIWPSRTSSPTPHVVTLGLWHCTCEAAVLGNRDCWAITEAKRLFGDRR